MGQLEWKIHALKQFTKNEEVKKAIDEIGAILLKENEFNLEANIDVGEVYEEELNISDMSYMDDYEITSGCFNVDGEEYDEDEKDEEIERLTEEKEKLEPRFNELSELEDERELTDEEQDEYDDLDTEISDLETKIEEFEDAEWEYDEIMWNTVWNYNGYVDTGIARQLGFGILETRDGTEYMFLQGCGMDLSPKHVAYQALKFGHVEECRVNKFRDINYFEYVVGKETSKEVYEALGITKCIETAIEEQKRRMKEFDDKINRLAELRKKEPVVAQMGALALMSELMRDGL
jgi:hypothetical protein|tara:strand:- start:8331 stop:9203 length:873 start_codon:yes stop_codon:yes gene_type:complete